MMISFLRKLGKIVVLLEKALIAYLYHIPINCTENVAKCFKFVVVKKSGDNRQRYLRH